MRIWTDRDGCAAETAYLCLFREVGRGWPLGIGFMVSREGGFGNRGVRKSVVLTFLANLDVLM